MLFSSSGYLKRLLAFDGAKFRKISDICKHFVGKQIGWDREGNLIRSRIIIVWLSLLYTSRITLAITSLTVFPIRSSPFVSLFPAVPGLPIPPISSADPGEFVGQSRRVCLPIPPVSFLFSLLSRSPLSPFIYNNVCISPFFPFPFVLSTFPKTFPYS